MGVCCIVFDIDFFFVIFFSFLRVLCHFQKKSVGWGGGGVGVGGVKKKFSHFIAFYAISNFLGIFLEIFKNAPSLTG